jgi:hypothetical protein
MTTGFLVLFALVVLSILVLIILSGIKGNGRPACGVVARFF